MNGRTAGLILAAILLLTPLLLGTHSGGTGGGSGSSGTTTGCAGLDSVYAPTRQETALGSWDDCSDGSRARFVGREDALQMEIDPSRRQSELGYRDGEVVWNGRRQAPGHYQGEFKVVDTFGETRWAPCDVDVQNDVLTLCRRVTCRRTSQYR